MARVRRLRLVDYPFHVIVRGTNQQPIFRGEGDRIFFHRTLVDAAAAHGMAVHAYVFSGTLWQGGFRSSVVDTERYFLTCQRYIELNPVRAGICHRAVDFAWSSHRHYARGAGDDLVTPHSIHRAYPSARYAELFEEQVSADDLEIIRDSVNHGLALGTGQLELA